MVMVRVMVMVMVRVKVMVMVRVKVMVKVRVMVRVMVRVKVMVRVREVMMNGLKTRQLIAESLRVHINLLLRDIENCKQSRELVMEEIEKLTLTVSLLAAGKIRLVGEGLD